MKSLVTGIVFAAGWLAAFSIHAASLQPMTFEQQWQSAHGVFRGTVVGSESFQDTNKLIWTRTVLRVDEAFKGKFPATLQILHRGGEANGVGMTDDSAPRLHLGEQYVLWVSRRPNGTLFVCDGELGAMKLVRGNGNVNGNQKALLGKIRQRSQSGNTAITDFSDQSAGAVSISPSGDTGGSSTNGLLADSYGAPTRLVTSDRGEMIPYLVDAQFLPSGMNLTQALGAVSNAFAAWASACSCRFVFAGTNNFGQPPVNFNTNDGVIRVQLHDAYNYIPPGNILGIGGSYFSTNFLPNGGWRPGGNVAGVEYDKSQCGFIVLKHTNVVMQTLSTFTEVLTHEIGHVLGLAHSSDVTTNDPVLVNSIMYYLAHEDGRGATLNSYDTNVVRQSYPFDTPPYSYDRVMDITTSPFGPPNVAGINSIELRGYDLQETNVTVRTNNASTSPVGSFSLSGQILKFSPAGYYGDARIDPASSSYYEIIYARFSDGTNASPYIKVRTISHNPDSDSPASDGLPDAWMNQYFGHTTPSAGDKSRAIADADADKLNNLQEYIAGMVPTNRVSAQSITSISSNQMQWQAKAYELYEVQCVTNLTSTNWTRFGSPVLPTSSNAVISNLSNPLLPQSFFRVVKVP